MLSPDWHTQFHQQGLHSLYFSLYVPGYFAFLILKENSCWTQTSTFRILGFYLPSFCPSPLKALNLSLGFTYSWSWWSSISRFTWPLWTRCWSSGGISLKRRKTTVRYHLTPVRMALIKKNTNNKRWRGCEEKRTPVHCWWECKLVQPLQKTVWKFFKKLKIELSYGAIPLLGIYPKKIKTLIWKDMCTPMFIAASFTIAKTWKQPKCPLINEWVKKVWYDIDNGILLSHICQCLEHDVKWN